MAGRQTRQYTPDEKAVAVSLADQLSQRKAEHATGIPHTTIQYWCEMARSDSDFAHLVQTKEREMQVGQYHLGTLLQERIEQLIATEAKSSELRDAAVAYGIIRDKQRLTSADNAQPKAINEADAASRVVLPTDKP
jgi:hypothetical protein